MNWQIKLLVLIMAMLGVILPASAQNSDSHCLEEVWQRTNPTEEEKIFDLENDRSFYEFARYSCENGVSASEVEGFLEEIRVAVEADNKDEFAKLVKYPFHLYPEDEFIEFTEGLVSLEGPEEIVQHYNAIVNDNFRKLYSCASVDKLVAYGLGTIMIARGYFRIEINKDKTLKLAMVGTYDEKASVWYEQNCQRNYSARRP